MNVIVLDEKSLEILTDMKKQREHNAKLKRKISKVLGINESDIILTSPKRGTYKTYMIINNQRFYDMSKEELMEILNSIYTDPNDKKEFGELIEIKSDLLCSAWKIKKNMLDPRGNNFGNGYGIGQKRGGFDYNPPLGWIRFGINVKGKYDNHNDDWLAWDNRDGEWAIAYHGICVRQHDGDKVKKTGGVITRTQTLKKGPRQAYKDFDDTNNPGKKVGDGVYCSPNPDILDHYAGKVNINGKDYKVGFMLRVHPKKIRIPQRENGKKDYWIVSGSYKDTRPYGILLKEC